MIRGGRARAGGVRERTGTSWCLREAHQGRRSVAPGTTRRWTAAMRGTRRHRGSGPRDRRDRRGRHGSQPRCALRCLRSSCVSRGTRHDRHDPSRPRTDDARGGGACPDGRTARERAPPTGHRASAPAEGGDAPAAKEPTGQSERPRFRPHAADPVAVGSSYDRSPLRSPVGRPDRPMRIRLRTALHWIPRRSRAAQMLALTVHRDRSTRSHWKVVGGGV